MFEMEVNADTKLVFIEPFSYYHPAMYYHIPRPIIAYKPDQNILELDTSYFIDDRRETKFFRVRKGREILYTAALAPEINTVFVLKT